MIAAVAALVLAQTPASDSPGHFEQRLAGWRERVQRIKTCSFEERQVLLRRWASEVETENSALVEAMYDARRAVNPLSRDDSPEGRRLATEFEDTLGLVANALEEGLNTDDPREFRAWALFGCANPSYYHGDAWRWPRCGTGSELRVTSLFYRPLQKGAKRHPDWMLELVRGADPVVAMQAAASLGAEEWPSIKALQSDPRPKWRAIPLALIDAKSVDFAEVVRAGLEDASRDIRCMAQEAVGEDGEKRDEFLRREIPRFRSASRELKISLLALCQFAESDDLYIEARRLLTAADVELRSQAIGYLAEKKHPVTSEELRFAVAHGDEDTKVNCISAAVSHPDMIQVLLELSSDPEIGEFAWSKGCGAAGISLLGKMCRCLAASRDPKTGDFGLSEGSLIDAMVRLGPSTDKEVREFYASRDAKYRAIAVRVAAQRRQATLLDIVDDAMRRDEKELLRAVADEIYKLPHALAFPRLQKLVADPAVGVFAISSLGWCGHPSDLALLKRLSTSADRRTSEAARMALDLVRERYRSSG